MDNLTANQRSENMRCIKSKDTAPELIIRKLIHRLGYRYRLHRNDLPGKPDLTFPSRNKIIFIHGCFWHQHQDENCKIARIPKSKKEYWIPKLKRNVERDHENQAKLKRLGWDIFIIWECEIKNIDIVTINIIKFLS